jgi:hypothetical protein
MVKWIVKKGKISQAGKKYRKGDIIDMNVADAEKLPHGVVERVQETKQKKQDKIEPEPVQKEEPDATKG